MFNYLKLAVSAAAVLICLPVAGTVYAADMPRISPGVEVRQSWGGWYGSWSPETGQVPTPIVGPAYAGTNGRPFLPTGYAIVHYTGAYPYCTWITRRANGYGGRTLFWPVEICH